MNRRRRQARPTAGFTLVEALVSIAIAAGMLAMIAVIFRQSSQVTARVRGSAYVHQVARQVFEQFGRDLAGTSTEGFIFLRCQSRNWNGDDWRTSGYISFYVNEEGDVVRLQKARTDMLVLLASGHHISGVDAHRTSSFARIIWGQSERVNGTDNDCPVGRPNTLRWEPAQIQGTRNVSEAQYLIDKPEFQGKNQVLARHQTLLLPDQHAVEMSNSSYPGRNRGPDFFNMGINDLNRFFWPVMGGYKDFSLYGNRFDYETGPNNRVLEGFNQLHVMGHEDLMPWRTASKVFRLGRNGPGLDDESPGSEGAGDLAADMIDQEPPNILTDGEFPRYAYRGVSWSFSSGAYRNGMMTGWRGHERTRIYGQRDYHRLMAFGVPVFQVDFSDGRRDHNKKLIYWPEQTPSSNVMVPSMHVNGDLERCYQWKFGPGPPVCYAWNHHSPEHIRNVNLRVTRPVCRSPLKGPACGPWGEGGSWWWGSGGWARPKAIRVRMIMVDHSTDPPTAFEFQQTFTLLAQ